MREGLRVGLETPSTTLRVVPLPVPGRIRFAGYAAVFGVVDLGGDVVRAGAFARTLARGTEAPLLWQHRGAAIGRVEYLAEDGRGLRVIARVSDEAAAKALRDGAARGLSFGYRVRRAAGASTGSGLGPRELIELDLTEVSLVARPMQPLAMVHAVE